MDAVSQAPQLNILALGDRFSAAYKSLQDSIQQLGVITYRSEHRFKNAQQGFEFIRDSSFHAVIMPNPYGNARRLSIYRSLRKVNFPVIVFDRGALPNSWFFDVGFNADSPSYHPLVWDKPLTDEQNSRTINYIESVRNSLPSLERQGPRQTQEALLDRYGIAGKKIVFVALQRPSDTTIKYFSSPIDSYDNFIAMLQDVAQRTQESLSDFTLLVKKHPLETSAPFIDHVTFVDEDTHINDLISVSDMVMVVNSGVGLLASLWNKPVLVAGTAFYRHDGLNRQVKNADDVEYFLRNSFCVNETSRNRFIHHLIEHLYSFGTFTTQLVQQKDGSLRNITRNIAFDTLRFPEFSKKKRVLFVTSVIPWPINRGNAQRTDQMIRALRDLGFQIDLLVLNQSEARTTSADIRKRLEARYPGISVHVRKHPNQSKWRSSAALLKTIHVVECIWDYAGLRFMQIRNANHAPQNIRRAIASLTRRVNYDAVWFNYAKLVQPNPHSNALVVCDLHDYQTDRIQNDVLPKIKKPLFRSLYLRQFRSSEARAIRNIDIGIAITAQECETFAKLGSSAQLRCIEATADSKHTSVNTPKDCDLLFIGSNSDANIDSLVWFLGECFPHIVQQRPGVTLKIAGRVCHNKRLNAVLQDNPQIHGAVKTLGFVENLDTLYSASRLVISPIVKGTGMKIKVVEAMAYGVPLVATDKAIEGTCLVGKLPTANTADHFIQQVIHCLSETSEREKRAEIAREEFLANHSFTSLPHRLSAVLEAH